jgi:hypothetical protein
MLAPVYGAKTGYLMGGAVVDTLMSAAGSAITTTQLNDIGCTNKPWILYVRVSKHASATRGDAGLFSLQVKWNMLIPHELY